MNDAPELCPMDSCLDVWHPTPEVHPLDVCSTPAAFKCTACFTGTEAACTSEAECMKAEYCGLKEGKRY